MRVLLPALLLTACVQAKAEDVQSSRSMAPSTAHLEASADQSAAVGRPSIDPVEPTSLSGRVRSVLRAGHYTYVQLQTTAGPTWVVTPARLQLDEGQTAAFAVFGRREDFHSRRLQRDFDALWFGSLREPAAGSAAPS